MSKEKKKKQLGMDPGTASHRLKGDIMFSFLIRLGYKCFRCGEDLTREDFSVDHIQPWLDSEDPVDFFFDLENVDFSHKSCNYSNKRTFKRWDSLAEAQRHYSKEWRRKNKEKYKKARREKYLRRGT